MRQRLRPIFWPIQTNLLSQLSSQSWTVLREDNIFGSFAQELSGNGQRATFNC